MPQANRLARTTCPYCGVGCGIKAQVDENDRIIQMLDDPDNESSLGMLCVKGRFGYTFVHHQDRLTTPLVRRGGRLTPATWDEALDTIAGKLERARDTLGPQSVFFYAASGTKGLLNQVSHDFWRLAQ